jgi:RND family efflux transporter MFP subunit
MPVGTSRFSRRARIAVAVVLVAATGLIVASLNGRPARSEAQASAAPAARGEAVLTVSVATLQSAELPRTITMNGTIQAWQDVIISPEVGGYRVAEVKVDVGDRVTKGQVLVELSTALLDADVATKRALLNQREAQRVNAEAAQKRAQSLSAMNALSQADLDRLNSEALAARASVESARADLEASQLRLKFTKVTAPDDGVITSRTVTVGQIAQAGNEMLRLLRNGRIEWRGEAPESRVGELQAGQPVKVTTADNAVFQGKIRVVAPTIAALNRTGLVYVDLPPDSRLRPGMFARGEIEIARGMTYTVPLQSVVSSDGYSYVFVLRPDNTVERRRIETGAVRDASIEVTGGLNAGERIVDKGAGFLKDGDLVNVSTAGGS